MRCISPYHFKVRMGYLLQYDNVNFLFMYEIVQHSHSPSYRATINIERRHFINFRHFGKVNQGDSAIYTFFTTLRTLVLLLSRGGDFLLSNFTFFGRLGLVGCAAGKSPASMRARVSNSQHTSVTTDSCPLPSSSTSDWLPSCWKCCCVTGALCLV